MTIATVPLYHAMAVWSVALESHFGWSRGQLGLALTFTRIEGGLMGPLEGYLTDRLGARRMIFIGLIVLGIGFLIFAGVQSLWMFYVAFIVMALGQGLGSWLPLMTTINNWFIRNRPQDYGQLPDGDPPAPTPPATEEVTAPSGRADRPRPADTARRPAPHDDGDLTAAEALKTPAFWLISFGHGFTSMVILAIMTHLGLLLKDEGFDVQTTGWIVVVYTATAMVFQLVGGYMGDRWPKNIALFVFTSIQAAAVVVLTLASSLLMFYLFAVLFGIGFGGRNPLTTAIRGEYFGRTSFGRILGLSTVPMNVLLLIGSPMAGYMRDIQDSYDMAFLILAGFNFLGGVLFLFARKPRVEARR
ncbi:L-lactate transporter [Geodia barretti]|uniref:L-lactate transporter n=1 Tax=Geodia barretti TaxID=519541 RepID=A0AA35U421_GEOBA|nr:L-lactate transporter [Geodia barretti]